MSVESVGLGGSDDVFAVKNGKAGKEEEATDA